MTGEGDLIARHFRPLADGFAGARRLLDDVAVVAPSPGHELVITHDVLSAGVHFFPDDAPGDVGFKAIAVNASDLIAKGAEPLAFMLGLSIPSALGDIDALLAGLAAGMREAFTAFGGRLAGGDISRIDGALTLGVTAIGTAPAGVTPARDGAQDGDLLFVSGTLGDSATGLALRLDAPHPAKAAISPQDRAHFLRAYLRPEPPRALAPLIARFATASMDISDGLALDLTRLADASAVNADVWIDRLPCHPCLGPMGPGQMPPGGTAASGAPQVLAPGAAPWAWDLLVAGGDDYQVLASVPEGRADEFEAQARAVGVRVTQIGVVRRRSEDAETATRFTWNAGGGERLLWQPTRLGHDHLSA